jgi:hypothetical protein
MCLLFRIALLEEDLGSARGYGNCVGPTFEGTGGGTKRARGLVHGDATSVSKDDAQMCGLIRQNRSMKRMAFKRQRAHCNSLLAISTPGQLVHPFKLPALSYRQQLSSVAPQSSLNARSYRTTSF